MGVPCCEGAAVTCQIDTTSVPPRRPAVRSQDVTPTKINVAVGAYRDEAGKVRRFAAARAAGCVLLRSC